MNDVIRRPPGLLDRRAVNGAHQHDPEFRRLVAAVRRNLPWLEKADTPAVWTWCELEMMAVAAFNDLQEHGLLRKDAGAEDGAVRGLANTYQSLRKTQLAFARELGMTPAARMAIKLTGTRVALDLAAQLAHADGEDGEEV